MSKWCACLVSAVIFKRVYLPDQTGMQCPSKVLTPDSRTTIGYWILDIPQSSTPFSVVYSWI